MKIGRVIGVTVILVFIFLAGWPKLKQSGKSARIAFFSLMAIDWLLAVALIFFPELPGPGQFIDFIYKSFGTFL